MNVKFVLIAMIALLALPVTSGAKKTEEFTESFPLAECTFLPTGNNPYFSLEPGNISYFDNSECFTEGDCDEFEELRITALNDTLIIPLEIDGQVKNIVTRVVEEYEEVEGELAEISMNYFAECKETQDVYYFGEDVDIYDEEGNITHEGAWLAGVDGAMPGIIMPGGAFMLGARYFQEIAPEAMDRAEHVAMGLEVEVPAGTFEDCVEVEETTPFDKKELSTKIYCPDVGLVIDEDLALVESFQLQ